MHRAVPMGKDMQRWRKLSQDLHHDRLRSMKPSIDNAQPRTYAHLQTKKKREQLLLERYAQIENENRILLEKMAEIMGRPTFPRPTIGADPPPFRSLNEVARRRRLRQITEENQQILKRIQTSGPNYDHRVWDQHWHDQQGYLRNLCEYPCILIDPKAATRTTEPTLHLDRSRPSTTSMPKKKTSRSQRALTSPSKRPSSYPQSPLPSTPKPRRRKKKGAMSMGAIPSSRLIFREGKNIEGNYVIVSVVEVGGGRSRRSSPTGSAHQWQLKVYDPQFSDETIVVVDFHAIVEFISGDNRSELLLEGRRTELANVIVGKLHVDATSGRLRAWFGPELGDGSCWRPLSADDSVASNPTDYDTNEFADEADRVAPSFPEPTDSDAAEAPPVIEEAHPDLVTVQAGPKKGVDAPVAEDIPTEAAMVSPQDSEPPVDAPATAATTTSAPAPAEDYCNNEFEEPATSEQLRQPTESELVTGQMANHLEHHETVDAPSVVPTIEPALLSTNDETLNEPTTSTGKVDPAIPTHGDVEVTIEAADVDTKEPAADEEEGQFEDDFEPVSDDETMKPTAIDAPSMLSSTGIIEPELSHEDDETLQEPTTSQGDFYPDGVTGSAVEVMNEAAAVESKEPAGVEEESQFQDDFEQVEDDETLNPSVLPTTGVVQSESTIAQDQKVDEPTRSQGDMDHGRPTYVDADVKIEAAPVNTKEPAAHDEEDKFEDDFETLEDDETMTPTAVA